MENPRPAPDETRKPASTLFDCNICFEEAKVPVVTKCGHLYCWDCISVWLERGALDCPVCKAGLSRENVIPIYGRGDPDPAVQERLRSEPRPIPPREPGPSRANPWYNDTNTSSNFSVRLGLPFAPMIGPSYSSDREHNRMRLTPEEARRRTMTQFFLFLGLALIILIVSS